MGRTEETPVGSGEGASVETVEPVTESPAAADPRDPEGDGLKNDIGETTADVHGDVLGI